MISRGAGRGIWSRRSITCPTVCASLYTGTSMEISSGAGRRIGRLVRSTNSFPSCRSWRGHVFHVDVADDRDRPAGRGIIRRLTFRAYDVELFSKDDHFGDLGRQIDGDRFGTHRRDSFDAARTRAAADALDQIVRDGGTPWPRRPASRGCCRASTRRCPRSTTQRPACCALLLRNRCADCAA